MTTSAPPPVDIILDTDIGGDCDDAGALAVLHALADLGEANILACMYCCRNIYGPACIAAINHYHGRSEIPIGTLADSGDDGFNYYAEHLAKHYPHHLRPGVSVPDAKCLYRQVLAARPDGSVVIVAIGMLSNLRHLLETRPDAFSALDGAALVARKVKTLVVVGGCMPNSQAMPDGREWNFMKDSEAAGRVAETWPTPIVFSGFEIGVEIHTGGRLHTQTPADNPVRKAYELRQKGVKPRQSWDQTGVLYAVRGLRDYWITHPENYNRIDPKTGSNAWSMSSRHRHLALKKLMPAPQMAQLIEDLMIKPPLLGPVSPNRVGVA